MSLQKEAVLLLTHFTFSLACFMFGLIQHLVNITEIQIHFWPQWWAQPSLSVCDSDFMINYNVLLSLLSAAGQRKPAICVCKKNFSTNSSCKKHFFLVWRDRVNNLLCNKSLHECCSGKNKVICLWFSLLFLIHHGRSWCNMFVLMCD